jgi:anti-sigma regulatory factor (Ser/Thr protein kinase)
VQHDHPRRDPPSSDTDPPALHIEVPGLPELLAPLRQQLAAWLHHAGADEEDKVAIQTAAGEAATNVVEHAYHNQTPGPLRVFAELDALSVVRIEITDTGRWRPQRGQDNHHRGRGLDLMREMMDDLDFATDETGTRVIMRRRLRTESDRPTSAGT